MAAAGVSFKAVGASLDTLAKRCHALPKGAPSTFAYANSGVLQQAGVVARERYIVPGRNAETTKNGYSQYTAPPGATHGPISTRRLSRYGEPFGRDERGRWGPLKDADVAQKITTERKLFVKGKFVDRSGGMIGFAADLAHDQPSTRLDYEIVDGETLQSRKRGQISASIDANGRGILTLSDGYRAAEVGSRGRASNGVKGWYRALRTASSRWSTLIRKKYPELLSLRGAV